MYIRSLKDAEPFEVAGIKFGMLLPRDVTDSVEVVWEKLRADQATPIDRHPTFDQLFFILKGTGEVTIGESKSIVGPETVVFIPRNTDHTIIPVTEEGLEYIYFIVWGAGVPESEKGWKRNYLRIHERRVHPASE